MTGRRCRLPARTRQSPRAGAGGRRARLAAAAIAACCLLVLASQAAIAAVACSASLDRSTMRVGEQAVLTVRIEGDARNIGEPRLPALPGFDVYGGGQSQNFSFINGKVQVDHSYMYYLRAKKEGEFVIPAIALQIDGSTYSTREIPLKVLTAGAQVPSRQPPGPSGAAPPPVNAAGDDYFATMGVDQDTVVVGQQVILTFAFYRNARASLFDSPQYTPPETEGFWREDLPPERHSTVNFRGRLYDVTEIRYALFPTRAGKLSIGEALVRVPEDMFSSFFRRSRPRGDLVLRTLPLTVVARPLPGGAPSSFGGTVATDLSLRTEVDRNELPAGEALTLRLRLEGDGYLAGAAKPDFPDLPGVRIHDAGSGLDSKPVGGRLHGVLLEDKLVVPGQQGQLTLPAIEYSYFDTDKHRYVTLRTQPIEVKVTPGAAPEPGALLAGTKTGIEVLGEDIYFIHAITGTMRPYGGPLPQRPLFWMGLISPAAAWLLSGALVRRRQRVLADPLRRRASRALRDARRRLSGDGPPAVRVAATLRGYFGDKLGRQAAGLTQDDVLGWMLQANVAESTRTRAVQLLARCDAQTYAGAAGHDDGLVSEAHELLGLLEREAGRG